MEIRKTSSRVSQAKTVDYISEPSENPIEKLIIISGSQGSSPRCTKKELLFLGVLLFGGQNDSLLNQGVSLVYHQPVRAGYHQSGTALYIIIAKAKYSLRLMIYTFGDEIHAKA